ncbi:pleiotropic drug resistance protein 2-like [Malus domestica]|uniref:pleiotropic drug resistance protein 2-like n=1 Tax=Malus domestica TaxID=3750 RepID=UPI003976F0E3
MAAGLAGEDLSRQTSSRGSWRSTSVREMWNAPNAFQRSGRQQVMNEEEELKWAAIERLPTYDRMRRGMLRQTMSNGKLVAEEIDMANLGEQEKKRLMDSILRAVEDDNEKFLQKLRARNERVGIDVPKVEVRFEKVSIEGDAYVGSRALPTLLNSSLNMIEGIIGMLKLLPSKKRNVQILQDVSGIVRPSRMTLLLGPPSSGKTTLLKALAGKLHKDLRNSHFVYGILHMDLFDILHHWICTCG